MHDGPVIASVAALIGDPARANLLTALIDGRALTVSELAEAAGVSLQTTSGHLAKLAQAGLVCGERQGRHRYFRLSGSDVAQVLEGLMGLAERTGAHRVRTGPRDPALRTARVCYDHLAGEYAVALLDGLLARSVLIEGPELKLAEGAQAFFRARGIDLDGVATPRRPLCRRCLDWSERRSHLAGALGAAVLDRLIQQNWAQRAQDRAVLFTSAGVTALREEWGVRLSASGTDAARSGAS